MKPTTPDKIRNVALISHGGAGKTSLAEAMLFDAGAGRRPVEQPVVRLEVTTPEGDSGSGWVQLLKWSAIASIIIVALVNIFAGLIPPLLVFAVLWLIGVVWLRRATKSSGWLL